MTQSFANKPWTPALGALAIGCISVAVILGTVRAPSAPTGEDTPRTAALLGSVAEFKARMRSQHSGLCAAQGIINMDNGNPAVQQNCTTGSLQRLTFEQLPDSEVYRIRRSFDGKCLEAVADANQGTRAHFWTCHQGDSARSAVSADAQLWALQAVAADTYRITSVDTGENLVITGGSYAQNAELTLRAGSGSMDEVWQFEQRVNSAADLGEKGQWGPLLSWPFVPVHAAVLPDNKILTWSSNERDEFKDVIFKGTFSAVYDLDTGVFSEEYIEHHDMFCAGISMLADGRVLTSGGNGSTFIGSVFNPDNGRWEDGGRMSYARWYGTTLTLPDGDAFATFARRGEEVPERYSVDTGWSEVPGASMVPLRDEQNATNSLSTSFVADMQWYAFMHVAPDGRLFHSGPTQTLHWFDPDGVGSVQEAGIEMSRNRQFGTSVMYRPGKLLIAGGADPVRADKVSEFGQALGGTETAVTVDINGSVPTVNATQSMQHPRVQHNAVVMPNGEVLVVGGDEWGMLFSDRFAVFESEIWNPDTETWRTVDSISTPRTYHSWAVLLQDGRVLSGGGGLCGTCGVNHRTAQIFTPPYLYNADGTDATRPELGSLATSAFAGESLFARVANGNGDEKFSLLRLSGVTHSINTDQRWIPLQPKSLVGDVVELALPANPNELIPGNYWLFAYNDAGTPSLGHPIQVKVGQRTHNSAPIVPSSLSVTVTAGQQVDYAISTLEPDGQGVVFTVDTLPAGLKLDPVLGRITGTTNVTSAPASRFTASDGEFDVSGTINWRFSSVNAKKVASGGALDLLWLLALCFVTMFRRRRHGSKAVAY